MITLTSQQEFAEFTTQHHACVVFTAKWCGPCDLVKAIFQKIEDQHPEYSIATLDIDDTVDVAVSLQVTQLPYVMVFCDGKPTDEFIGARPLPVYVAAIDRVVAIQ